MIRSLFTALLAIAAFATAFADLPDELRWHALEEELGLISEPDTLPCAQEKTPCSRAGNRNWWYLFKKGQLQMADTTVQWPRFLGFCVDVYNWADKVFSTTNPEYVAGTGKRWRARLINDNWNDSYYFRFSRNFNSIMSGDIHVLAGASLQYMAVSYSYLFDITHAITGGPIKYKKQEFGFSCGRFAAEGFFNSNGGGTAVRTFGDYKKGHVFRLDFDGIDMSQFGIDAYYFFNGYKYSQAAAYSFSKIQKKSQGCWMGGLSYTNQDIRIDFSKLPPELIPYLKLQEKQYYFHYNDYNILIGYGYNAVFNPHWLYNVTVIPGIGFNHSYEDSTEGNRRLFSLSARAMMSFTYNSGNWFVGLQGKFRGNWYQSYNFSLFNSVESLVLSGGFRF